MDFDGTAGRRLRIVGRVMALVTGALVTGVLAPLAGASAETRQNCQVDKLEYANRGAYIATVSLNYKSASNGENYLYVIKTTSEGENAPIPLSKYAGKAPPNFPGAPALADGDEVWLTYHIINLFDNPQKSCRKDVHRLFYKSGVGQAMKFRSKGTTQNDNRCRYVGNMDKDCYTGQ